MNASGGLLWNRLREVLIQDPFGNWWIRYELLGEVLLNVPDDGASISKEIIREIRAKYNVGLPIAAQVWRDRDALVRGVFLALAVLCFGSCLNVRR